MANLVSNPLREDVGFADVIRQSSGEELFRKGYRAAGVIRTDADKSLAPAIAFRSADGHIVVLAACNYRLLSKYTSLLSFDRDQSNDRNGSTQAEIDAPPRIYNFGANSSAFLTESEFYMVCLFGGNLPSACFIQN